MVKRVLNFEDIIVFYLILSTGAVILGSNESLIIGGFSFYLLAYYIVKKRDITFTTRSFKILFFTISCISISTFINVTSFTTPTINFILGFSLKIINAFLVINLISFDVFIRKYIKQVFIISLISIICYFIFLIIPGISTVLPKLSSSDPHQFNFLIYIYTPPRFFPFPRNASIFYEPGVFQGIIIVALIFLRKLQLKNTRKRIYYFVLILALLTTFSTTGYIALILVLLLVFKELQISKIRLIITIAAVMVLFSYGIVNVVLEKKLMNPENQFSSQRRFADTFIEMTMFLKKPLFGYSYNYFKVKEKYLESLPIKEVWTGSTNSLTYHLALFGSFFMIPIFIGFYKLVEFINNKILFRFLAFFVFMVILMGETFLQKELFLVLSYYPYGLFYLRNK